MQTVGVTAAHCIPLQIGWGRVRDYSVRQVLSRSSTIMRADIQCIQYHVSLKPAQPVMTARLERAHELLSDLRRGGRRRLRHHAWRCAGCWLGTPSSKPRGHRGHSALGMRRLRALGVLPPQALQLCLTRRENFSAYLLCLCHLEEV